MDQSSSSEFQFSKKIKNTRDDPSSSKNIDQSSSSDFQFSKKIMDHSSSSGTQFSEENISREKSSSSDTQFSKEKIKYPISKCPEMDRLPIESLKRIQALCKSVPLKKSKVEYLRDKSSGFQTNTEEYYRRLFRLDATADDCFRWDGNLDFLFGLIDGDGDGDGEGDGDGNGNGFYEEYGNRFYEEDGNGFYEEYYDENGDYLEDCDENGDCCEEERDHYFFEEEEEDYDDGYVNWNLILMGKQFLLKFIEVEKIEADLKKVYIEKAQWALYNRGGQLADSIFFLERSVFMNSNMVLKISASILEANKHEDTQVWKISSEVRKTSSFPDKDGMFSVEHHSVVSFQHHSANSPFSYFFNLHT